MFHVSCKIRLQITAAEKNTTQQRYSMYIYTSHPDARPKQTTFTPCRACLNTLSSEYGVPRLTFSLQINRAGHIGNFKDQSTGDRIRKQGELSLPVFENGKS